MPNSTGVDKEYDLRELQPSIENQKSPSHLDLANMRQLPGRNVRIGNAGDLRDIAKIMSLGVEAVVEVADSEPPAQLPRELTHCRIPLADAGENDVWRLQLAITTTSSLLGARVPLLICCSAGMSRSVCLAAAGLALTEGRPFAEVLAEITATGPVDLSPEFAIQIRTCLKTLGSS